MSADGVAWVRSMVEKTSLTMVAANSEWSCKTTGAASCWSIVVGVINPLPKPALGAAIIVQLRILVGDRRSNGLANEHVI